MPVYGVPQAGSFPNAGNNLTTLIPGDSPCYLFNAETYSAPPPAQASVAFCRGEAPGGIQPPPMIFELICPGFAGEVDIQGSNVDADADYITVGSITTSPGYYSDAGGFRFYRAYLKTQTGGGAITVVVKP